jgi:hypothetical protein
MTDSRGTECEPDRRLDGWGLSGGASLIERWIAIDGWLLLAALLDVEPIWDNIEHPTFAAAMAAAEELAGRTVSPLSIFDMTKLHDE